jgi:alpha-beta hydrolase superfamily lysophospholipase
MAKPERTAQGTWAKTREPAIRKSFGDIVGAIANGDPLKTICDKLGFDASTVRKVILKDPELNRMYDESRLMQADAHADKIMEAADRVMSGELDPQAGRVAIDAMKWTSSRLKPQVYGDRVEAHFSASGGFVEALASIEKIAMKKRIDPPTIDLEADEEGTLR